MSERTAQPIAEYAKSRNPRYWLERIHALPRPESGIVRIMNVCGGHERTITQTGLRQVLPAYLQLIPGPGCPVCVCPEEDIQAAILLSLHPNTILATFGDMVRVPCNAPKQQPRSLREAQAIGGRVVPVATPAEGVTLAARHPDKQVVFFAAGFETTTAPLAALLARPALPDNLSILLSARKTWPAIAHMLGSDEPGFDALIAPGHVATIMGADQWRFVAEDHALPTAVAGFTPELLLQAIHAVLVQCVRDNPRLENCYPQCVTEPGNTHAQSLIAQAFDNADASWRGIGTIVESGYVCRSNLASHDARVLFPQVFMDAYARRGEMPTGCECARVVLGRVTPLQCRLYGTGCHPNNPIGPCMVSDEGACRIWWQSGVQADMPHAVEA